MPKLLDALGGGRALACVALFALLSVAVPAVIVTSADLAARQNASALLYERAGGHLQAVLLGLYDAALTNGKSSSAALSRESAQFQYLRNGSSELEADTRGDWPAFSRRIEALLQYRRSDAFDDSDVAELDRVTRGVEALAARLERQAKDKRESAAAAERGVTIASIAAGALMILGTAVFFILRGSTARKVLGVVRASEARLRASEAQLRNITDAVPALIAYVDTERRFRFHNKAYEVAFGLGREQVEGRTLLEVFGEALYAPMRANVDQVLLGHPVRFERIQGDAQGEPRDYAEHYFPRYGGDEDQGEVIGFYSLTTDISEMKRIDRMKTEFISTVSHELRTPLTSIRGSLGLLSGGVAGALPDAAKKLVDIARSNCERLIRLINNILDTEKIESGKMRFDLKVVELERLIAQSIAANEGFAGEHDVSFKLLASGEAVLVNVDGDALSQVLTNLLSNAVKFSPAGATVDVGITRTPGRVRVAVRDRGPGIPEEFRSRIFQKFSQADSSDTRQKGGTGLGLNISRAIVERLAGTIGFTREAGAGTTFFFELPEWQDAPGRDRPRTATTQPVLDRAPRAPVPPMGEQIAKAS